MKRVLILFLLAFVWIIQATAEKISEQEAYHIAQQFFVADKGLAKSPTLSKTSLQLAHTSTGYYVFNRGEGNGFILVAADDCFNNKVLGYADNGQFVVESIPDNMRWWLGEYDRQLKALQEVGANYQAKGIKENVVQTNRANIAPLCSAIWNQDSPYNNLCPTYNGTRCPTGCLATAIAQIMYYHKYPTQGVGSYSYEWFVGSGINKESQGMLAVDFSQRTYDFDIMVDDYSGTTSDASDNAVAQLMYDVGVASDMMYDSASSGTYTMNGANGLLRNFNYDKSLIVLDRNYFEDEEWVELIYSNLAQSMPVYYSGVNNSGGHAFVCDGYRDGYFHINWGWGGISNGYFLIDALDPMSQGIGGSAAGYNESQEVILNIKPAQADSKYTPLMYCTGEFDVTKKELTRTSNAILSAEISGQLGVGSFLNYSLGTIHITFGVKVVDANGNVTWIASTYRAGEYSPQSGLSKYSVSLKDFPAGDGEYLVYPAHRDAEGNWHEIRTNKQFYKRYLIATASGDNITFTNPSSNYKESKLEFGEWSFANLVSGEVFTATVNVSNTGMADFVGNPNLTICAKGTNYTFGIASSTPIELNLPMGTSTTATFSMVALPSGEYDFAVINGYQILSTGSLNITANPKGDPQLTLQSLHFANADNVPIDAIDITAQISCENSTYNGHLIFAVFSEDGTKNITRVTQPFSIKANETKTVKFQGAFTGVKENTTYKFGLLHYTNYMQPFGNGAVMFTTGVGSGIDDIGIDNKPVETSVYNLSGIRLLHFEAGVPLDFSSLASGIYIVKSGNNTKRIVVNN